jgi:hypothetical protein
MPRSDRRAKWAKIHAIAIIRGFAGGATLDNGKQTAPASVIASRNPVRLKRRHRSAECHGAPGGVLDPCAKAFLLDRGRLEIFVQNCPNCRKAAPAARAAAEALVDCAERLRTGIAAHGVPDICVAKNIARTNNHSVTGFNLEKAGSKTHVNYGQI